MELGGNYKLKTWLEECGWKGTIAECYTTKIGAFYRIKLESMVDMKLLNLEKLSLELGLQQESRSAEQIMTNNPPFQSNPKPEKKGFFA